MHPAETFELVFILLLAILALHWLAARARLPPSVALLVGGGALAFFPGLPVIELDPELVLVLFLPPLLMDGAFYTALAAFRRHSAGIVSLAVGAVVFTTLVVGVVVHWLVPELPWAACFALGAIVSPPDAVSARAVLQRVKLPRRLTTLLEGESLLNDASGLILFRFAVAAALTGSFDAVDAGLEFGFLTIGGVVVGAVVGGVWTLLLRRLGDETLMILASLILGWAAYLAGEAIHVSGVIATVSAGLVFGWYQHVVFTASVRIRAGAFWHVMVFLLEAMIFILIGLSLRGVLERVGGFETVVSTMTVPIVGVVIAMTVARFVWIFGCDAVLVLLDRMGIATDDPLGPRAATVMSWAGMRGVVTLAVALTVPETMPGRDLMLVAAFAAILVTVLFQGMTLGMVIRAVRLPDRDMRPPLVLAEAEAAVAGAQLAAVRSQAYAADGTLTHPRLLESFQLRADQTSQNADKGDMFVGEITAHYDIVIEAVKAGRAELVRLHRAHQINDETLHDLERDLDLEELSARAAKAV